MIYRALFSAIIPLFFVAIYLRKQEEGERREVSQVNAFSFRYMKTENETPKTIIPLA